jgi:hypothetical protein
MLCNARGLYVVVAHTISEIFSVWYSWIAANIWLQETFQDKMDGHHHSS